MYVIKFNEINKKIILMIENVILLNILLFIRILFL